MEVHPPHCGEYSENCHCGGGRFCAWSIVGKERLQTLWNVWNILLDYFVLEVKFRLTLDKSNTGFANFLDFFPFVRFWSPQSTGSICKKIIQKLYSKISDINKPRNPYSLKSWKEHNPSWLKYSSNRWPKQDSLGSCSKVFGLPSRVILATK